jgi:hypothetical protein
MHTAGTGNDFSKCFYSAQMKESIFAEFNGERHSEQLSLTKKMNEAYLCRE